MGCRHSQDFTATPTSSSRAASSEICVRVKFHDLALLLLGSAH